MKDGKTMNAGAYIFLVCGFTGVRKNHRRLICTFGSEPTSPNGGAVRFKFGWVENRMGLVTVGKTLIPNRFGWVQRDIRTHVGMVEVWCSS